MKTTFCVSVAYILLSWLSVCQPAAGQTVEWEQRFHINGNSSYNGVAIGTVNDGGFLITAGMVDTAYTGLVIRTNERGVPRWINYSLPLPWLDDPIIQHFYLGKFSYQSKDGNFVFVGIRVGGFLNAGDFYIKRIDTAGNSLWNSFDTIPHINCDFYKSLAPITRSRDNAYYGADIVVSADSTDGDIWLSRSNAISVGDWQIKLPSGPYELHPKSIQQVRNGNLLIFSHVERKGAPVGLMQMIMADTTGKKLWEKYILLHDTARTAVGAYETPDGGIAALGYYIGLRPNGLPYMDITLLKTDSVGSILWEKSLKITSKNATQPSVFRVTADGGFIIGGSTGEIGVDRYDIEPSTRDMFLMKVDSAGNKQWEMLLDRGIFDLVRDVQQTSDGNFVFLADVKEEGDMYADMIVVKVRNGPAGVHDGTSDKDAAESFHVYPTIVGQAQAGFSVSYRLPSPAVVTIKVYDVTGQCRVSVSHSGLSETGMHTAQISTSDLASGTYVVVFQAGDHISAQRVAVMR